jgi:DDE superfamily endonuclease
VTAHPEHYEWPCEDETHLETNPHLSRVWHRTGPQPTVPAGANRRLTVFGSVEAHGRGRIELLTVQQDAVGFARYLAALDARHDATGRDMILVLDNGPCHGSRATRHALAERGAWLEVIPLARYSPHLNPKEHAWRRLKRDHRGHLAGSLREFVDAAAAGLAGLGGAEGAIIDVVDRRPPPGTDGTSSRAPQGRQRPQTPHPPRRVFTCVYFDAFD